MPHVDDDRAVPVTRSGSRPPLTCLAGVSGVTESPAAEAAISAAPSPVIDREVEPLIAMSSSARRSDERARFRRPPVTNAIFALIRCLVLRVSAPTVHRGTRDRGVGEVTSIADTLRPAGGCQNAVGRRATTSFETGDNDEKRPERDVYYDPYDIEINTTPIRRSRLRDEAPIYTTKVRRLGAVRTPTWSGGF